MISLKEYEVWFLTGSQDLYGEKALRMVQEDAQAIVRQLGESPHISVRIQFKPVLTTPEDILKTCREANSTALCIGVVAWMHTFSPAKMWIAGLKALQKPLLDLHTQFGRDIPWQAIDMEFMNLNQTAHGGREFGFITARMKQPRKIVVGYWQEENVQKKIGVWCRVAAGWADAQGMKIARFGDNMRYVAVTEGDKVEAELRFGYSVNGYGIGDLVAAIRDVHDQDIVPLLDEYETKYDVEGSMRNGRENRKALHEAARIELAMRSFLTAGGFSAFTTTFEDLHDMTQLPGVAVQRLMADGFGFGAEGDWKTAALVRTAKVMSAGLPGGCSFMEDYTYHLDPAGKQVLGAHMLEVCASLAAARPRLEIHQLSIGGKADPPRLVFDVPAGSAINATVVDMGNRFRIIVNEIEVVKAKHDMPKLPVARALWVPKPDFDSAVESWILAGGGHHTVFSQAITSEYLEDFAEMAGVELILINDKTSVAELKKELRWNEVYYR